MYFFWHIQEYPTIIKLIFLCYFSDFFRSVPPEGGEMVDCLELQTVNSYIPPLWGKCQLHKTQKKKQVNGFMATINHTPSQPALPAHPLLQGNYPLSHSFLSISTLPTLPSPKEYYTVANAKCVSLVYMLSSNFILAYNLIFR